jgi:hypothetical protein
MANGLYIVAPSLVLGPFLIFWLLSSWIGQDWWWGGVALLPLSISQAMVLLIVKIGGTSNEPNP